MEAKNDMKSKTILVTGGNAGIGRALCRQLVERGCSVLMGARNAERGMAGLKAVTDKHPSGNIELIDIDVSSDASVLAAAESLKTKGVTLYALVNNAGVGFKTGIDVKGLLEVNFYGPKRCSDAFLPLLDKENGRIVNVSSGAASMWLRHESKETKDLFTSADISWDQLAASVDKAAPSASMGGYGVSKAGLCALTLQQSKQYPNLICTSLSPGFIDTAMTRGYGAKLTPEEGTVSLMKCLFGNVTSGFYYGSDGLRSPLTVTRDPGTPEYQGEENPDETRYNK
eukprot:g3633.t1